MSKHGCPKLELRLWAKVFFWITCECCQNVMSFELDCSFVQTWIFPKMEFDKIEFSKCGFSQIWFSKICHNLFTHFCAPTQRLLKKVDVAIYTNITWEYSKLTFVYAHCLKKKFVKILCDHSLCRAEIDLKHKICRNIVCAHAQHVLNLVCDQMFIVWLEWFI